MIYFFLITDVESKYLLISVNGVDSSDCGQSIPCRTIGYFLNHRAADDYIIKLVNNKFSEPFTINRSFPLLNNITLLGINGRPIILAQGPFRPSHLFAENELQKVKFITLRVENLIFRGIGIAQLIAKTSKNITFQNCHFENTITSREIIRIEGHPSKYYMGFAHFRQCHFVNNVALDSSRAISVNLIHSIFHNCLLRNNWGTGNGLIFLAGRSSTLRNSYFAKNTLMALSTVNTVGGVIFASTGSTVEILNCSFKQNKAPSAGGAIFTNGKKLIIKSSLFQYNATVSKYAAGGAVSAYNSVVVILNCSFKRNWATLRGGAIYTERATVILNSRFKNNKAKRYGDATLTGAKKLVVKSSVFEYNVAAKGGAVCAYITNSIVEILNCLFKDNLASQYGGAIYTKATTKILNSSFINNNAMRYGGAILASAKKLVIESSAFEYNKAAGKYGTTARGGAIFLGSTKSIVEILNCSLKENLATQCGGAIYTEGEKLVIKSSMFAHNAAVSGDTTYTQGGAVLAYSDYSIIEIVGCSFKGNRAESSGGAIHTQGKKLIIKLSFFEYNTAVSEYGNLATQYGSGGAIYTNGTTEILNSSFKMNKATRYGGAILTGAKKLVIKSSAFEYNKAVGKYATTIRGGAVFAYITEILNCSFKGNLVTHYGGAIYTENTTKILNCSFKHNKATSFGGAIMTVAKKLVIKSSAFEYNSGVGKYGTTARGGAIFLGSSNSIVEILNCSFKGNLATQCGGAIYTEGEKLVIKSSLFVHNTAVSGYITCTQGGAVSAYSANSIIEIVGCSFKGNRAESFGGAIHTQGKKLVIKLSLFVYNTAVSDYSNETSGSRYSNKTYGGAVSLFNVSAAEIMNCSFQGNKASLIGGVIYCEGKKIRITSSLFEYNTAGSNSNHKTPSGEVVGGAVYTGINSMVEILGCSFKKNKATIAGGAIFADGNSTIQILNCYFNLNKALSNGGAIFTQGKKFTVKWSLFEHNTVCENHECASHGGAISCNNVNDSYRDPKNPSLFCIIFNSTFRGNMAGQDGGAVCSSGRLTLKASSFYNNSAGEGGAVYKRVDTADSSFQFIDIILECFFIHNTAFFNGGAVSNFAKELLIQASIFENNRVLGNTGKGGAIFTISIRMANFGHVNITDCLFNGNYASFRGGAIMAAANILLVRNSSFRSSSFPQSESYAGGDLLYSRSGVILEHVSFLDVDSYNLQTSLIVHENYYMEKKNREIRAWGFSLSLKAVVHLKCLTGKNIAVSNHSSGMAAKEFTFLSVFCSFCSKNSYSIHTSHLDLFAHTKSVKKTNAVCYHCPLGGVCEKGKIRAANNFWGYSIGKEVHFTPCPFGYCCYEKECVNYSSCHTGRTGPVCSHCEEGLTENFVTPDCLAYEECYHPWYWLVVIIYGILYVIALMYLDEITKSLKSLLVPVCISNYFKYSIKTPIKISEICKDMLQFFKYKVSNEVIQDCQTDYVLVQEEDDEEQFERLQSNIEPISDEEIQSTVALCKENSEHNFFPGLLKIIVFFYQVNVLFKINIGSKSEGLVNSVQEVVSILFNLRTDGTFAQNFSWCPFNSLQPVSKVLLKSSFIIYLFLLIFFAFLSRKIGKLLRITGREMNSCRLLYCIARLSFISYAGITVACFSLLSCIQLGHLGKVLFMDGSIPCYQWWQIIVISVVFCWIVPFPFTIYASSKLLRNNMISSNQFLLCLLFPLPAACYWLYKWNKNAGEELEHDDEELLSEDVQDILQILEGPFRELDTSGAGKSYRLPWEAVLSGRRLVLIFVKTFVINAFLRLSLMLLCMSLFLMHHINTKPFSSSVLNKIETVSLLMLNVICFINLIPAYNYTYPLNSYSHTQYVIQTFKSIETALNLVFPFLVTMLVVIFTCIRILQFMFWLCHCLIRFIHFLSKCQLT